MSNDLPIQLVFVDDNDDTLGLMVRNAKRVLMGTGHDLSRFEISTCSFANETVKKLKALEDEGKLGRTVLIADDHLGSELSGRKIARMMSRHNRAESLRSIVISGDFNDIEAKTDVFVEQRKPADPFEMVTHIERYMADINRAADKTVATLPMTPASLEDHLTADEIKGLNARKREAEQAAACSEDLAKTGNLTASQLLKRYSDTLHNPISAMEEANHEHIKLVPDDAKNVKTLQSKNGIPRISTASYRHRSPA